MKRAIPLLALLIWLPVVAEPAPPPPEGACDHLSLKGLRLGMPASAIRQLGGEVVEPRKPPLTWTPEGSQWWQIEKRGEHKILLLQRDKADEASPIIAILMSLAVPRDADVKVTPASIVAQIEDKWGGPDRSDERTYHGGHTTHRSYWQVLTCDFIAWTETNDYGVSARPLVDVNMLSIAEIWVPIGKRKQERTKGILDDIQPPTPQ
jgi:hypothetical protein